MAKRTFGSSRDPLQVQVSVRLKLPRAVKALPAKERRALQRKLTQEAINYRLTHDRDHKYATTKIIRWRNPGRKGQLSRWRQGNQADAWATLKQWLRFATVDAVSVRND